MHRVVGLGILYFAFASIEGVLRITAVSLITHTHTHTNLTTDYCVVACNLTRKCLQNRAGRYIEFYCKYMVTENVYV